MAIDTLTPIHLLYVPTLNCNLGCRYCYLGSETHGRHEEPQDAEHLISTLDTAVEKFITAGCIPYTISLHGGEITTLSRDSLDALFTYITRYYSRNKEILAALGFKRSVPHVKTNLYNFHSLRDLFDSHRVSVSASVDLPLFLHEKYRTTRKGRSSLDRILENLRLLADYPHRAKISTTLFAGHYHHRQKLIDDIWKLHREYGFDMNRFNIMFGFASLNNLTALNGTSGERIQPLSGEEQVDLYHFLMRNFTGTELEPGLTGPWFEEFTPSYCTNCFNCGEKFFLLQWNGDVFSCVRGQGDDDFYYGNLLDLSANDVLNRAREKISLNHKRAGFDEDCSRCTYIHLCHTGCPFVKLRQGQSKSYTCKLQKAIYRNSPDRYPEALSDNERDRNVMEYAASMHPSHAFDLRQRQTPSDGIRLPNDLFEPKNGIEPLIRQDKVLTTLYADDAFLMEIDSELIPLYSQLTKPFREFHHLYPEQEITLHVRKDIFNANCAEPVRNTLHLQMLRDTTVVYGDEQRRKQEHLFTHEIFFRTLTEGSRMGDAFFSLPLTGLLVYHKPLFRQGVLNNLFVTTRCLREYHYTKQKNNGFYHIQALNLPFQNLEFFWD